MCMDDRKTLCSFTTWMVLDDAPRFYPPNLPRRKEKNQWLFTGIPVYQQVPVDIGFGRAGEAGLLIFTKPPAF